MPEHRTPILPATASTRKGAARRWRSRGFSLVEIMIVVLIIGVLATIAVPALLRTKANARTSRFLNDLRVACDAFEVFAANSGGWPPDGNAGLPPVVADDLPKAIWYGSTPVGGVWDWDYEQFGYKAGLSVYRPTATAAEFLRIDEKIDDGNLSTGRFRQRSNGYIMVLEF